MPVSRRVGAEDLGKSRPHLDHILLGARRERLLHHRLLGATLTAEGALQRYISSDPGLNLTEPVRPGENGDEGVLKLLYRRVLDRLLPDVDVGLYYFEQTH